MKINRANREAFLPFLVAIVIVVLLAVDLTACDQNEEKATSTKEHEHAAVDTGKSAEPTEVAAKALENKEQEAKRREKQKPQLKPQVKPLQQITPQGIAKAVDKTVHGTGSSLEKTTPVSEQQKANLESYSVTVSANKQLEIPGPPGELRVWIGISSKAPGVQQGMTAETKELEAVGETARVTPFTLGIGVEPKVSVCEKIDPSGSEVRFKLIPIKSGAFTVGANVELYDSGDCSGIPVPKSAKSVEVKVSVDEVSVIKQAIVELVEAAWNAFLTFWDKLLLIIFALLLFLIRKKLFKWFGFKGDE